MRTSLLFCALFFVSCIEQKQVHPTKPIAPPEAVKTHAKPETAKPKYSAVHVDPPNDPEIVTNRRQLTFSGSRSGEGYFSPDSKEMIFQSERTASNPFYQIYRMNLDNGETSLVSTGNGKTTCAYFHPSMKKALFASSHLDPDFKDKVKKEIQTRESGQKQKYSWSYDETFDLFEVDFKTRALKRLTKEKGYDAEASYSPDGKWIAFSSNRHAYTGKMSDDDQKLFEKDAAYMAEIYLMKIDGTGIKRLTFEKGYDGGPFFSPDGQKIVWRRFTPNGQSAEIMSMNLDGSDAKSLTRLNAMSWAPYYYPSGDYVIFTTNVLGFSNFELYIVDSAGKHEPVRVTYWDGFDGLPVFSPDGKKLSWTHHNEKGESQIYLADWNDQRARELLKLSPPLKHNTLMGHFSPEDARTIVEYLSADTLEGRLTGSPQEEIYVQYLSELFKELGLEPAGTQGFIQPYNFTSGVKLGPVQRLTTKIADQTEQLKVNDDFSPLSFSSSGEFGEAPVVFVGYGIVAAANESQPLYDSYQNIDVRNKWVIAFRDIPEAVPNERRVHLNMYSRPHHKALVARERGAKGLILVNGPTSGAKDRVMKLRFDGAGFAGAGLPVLSLADDLAAKLLKPLGKSLQELQQELDKGKISSDDGLTGEIKGLLLSAKIDLIQEKATGYNVLARLKVPGSTSTVMVGAHGDHLGRGVTGSSLAKGNELGRIHYGADDNASGVAALVQIAEEWSSGVRKGKYRPRQDLLFAIWSGEEIGLLGSTYYTKHTDEKISAYLNMDMVGRLRESLAVQGVGSANEWTPMFEKIAARAAKFNQPSPFSITLMNDPYVPSDAMSFYLAGIPSLTFFTGAHSEYHTPRDIPSTLNYPGISQIAQVVSETLKDVTTNKVVNLTYQKVEGTRKGLEGRSFRVYLGTIPDYAQEGIKGVRITGSSKNSPAEKAGLKTGDVIVELAKTKIENLYDYVYVLQSLKPNAKVVVKIKRGDKVEELEITPTLKE